MNDYCRTVCILGISCQTHEMLTEGKPQWCHAERREEGGREGSGKGGESGKNEGGREVGDTREGERK